MYHRIIHSLQRFPESSIYRTSTEALTKQRLNIVDAEGVGNGPQDISSIETKIGGGQIEELIKQAEAELSLIKTMESAKVFLRFFYILIYGFYYHFLLDLFSLGKS